MDKKLCALLVTADLAESNSAWAGHLIEPPLLQAVFGELFHQLICEQFALSEPFVGMVIMTCSTVARFAL